MDDKLHPSRKTPFSRSIYEAICADIERIEGQSSVWSAKASERHATLIEWKELLEAEGEVEMVVRPIGPIWPLRL